jgi:hypothetical protein
MTTAETTIDGQVHDREGLAQRFMRTFGRTPTSGELIRFERARTGLQLRLPAQVRRGAATIVANL